MKNKQLLREFLLEIEVRKYTPRTIKHYRNSLEVFLKYLELNEIEEVEDITPGTLRQFTQFMTSKGRKATYINSLLKVFKSFFTYAIEEGYIGKNILSGIKWCKEEKPVITAFKDTDVKKMLSACSGNDYISLRDKAILSLLFETGIRTLELCTISEKDIYEDFILIHGKHHKQRVVPLTPILKKTFIKYKASKENYFALKRTDNFFFLSFHGRQLTNCAIENIVKKYGQDVEGIRVSPHTCRHYYSQKQLKLGTDLYTLSRLLGHSNVKITQVYLDSLRDEEVIQIAKQNSVLMNL